MDAAKVDEMAERNETHADNGQNRFSRTMPDRQCSCHECEADGGDYHWGCPAMTKGAPADGDCRDDYGKDKPVFVDLMREKEVAANPEPGDKHDGRDTVHGANAGEADAELVETLAKGAARRWGNGLMHPRQSL
jgi:hypothetical protein